MAAARISFHRNPMMAQATIRYGDGSASYVFCSLPGGTPWFTFDPDSQMSVRVDGAQACDSFAQFKRFVTARFGHSPS